MKQALALRELLRAVRDIGEKLGVKEMTFFCKDERVVEFAKAHGFEQMPWTALRLKTRDLK